MNILTICVLPLKTMKYLILILFLIGGAFTAQSQEKKQSLKDLLFSGKLKKDSTGVIRSTDDLSQKIDTSTKKVPESVAANQPAPNGQQPVANGQQPAASVQQDKNAAVSKSEPTTNASTVGVATVGAATVVAGTDSAAAVAPAANTAPAKTNTKLWKEYNDSLVKTLSDEVLKSKQIKKNTYYLMVDYEIAPDGQVTFTNLTSTPENAFLTAQVRQIMDSTPLRLNPVVDSSNQGKKVKRKQQIVITKE